MSQITPEEMQKRGALLKKAKQILLQEYAAIRTQQHQQWIRDSETSWRTNGILMAYPPGKLYPSEQEIVEKALELYTKSLPVNVEVSKEVPIPKVKPEIPIDSPVNVTEQLQAVYKTGPVFPDLVGQMLVMPPDKYLESLTTPNPTEPVVEETPEVVIPETVIPETVIPEPTKNIETITEPSIEGSTTPKHSLLRSVLSGWLSKNKDKAT